MALRFCCSKIAAVRLLSPTLMFLPPCCGEALVGFQQYGAEFCIHAPSGAVLGLC